VEGCIGEDGSILAKKISQEVDVVGLSLKISDSLRQAGYVLLWDPQISVRV
jgi:hypothetical protein